MSIYVSLGFKKYGDDKLVTFSNTIYQHMSSDVRYTTLKSFVDDVKVKNDAFIFGISNAAQGGTKLTNAKNACREALLVLLSKIARRIEILAEDNDNDTSIVTDAGYEVRNTSEKTKEVITTLDIPVLKATNIENKSGAAALNWNTIKNAINYGIRLKKKSESDWQNGHFTNKKEFVFTNLEPDTVYEYQVYAQGSDGVASDFSAIATIYVS